ncbi:hypothetical protein GGS23DRAFT_573575 [Durotheca rogersii]|uniref:uncharacterized protein n=1 Tax=Durotheca rogersii TaxID=419775 RepID=UPI00221E84A5|nr:uncharacterized protein GGS23DRAFT_573575 [Durotheca rogersii]KAI5862285.1 hypothetical protein GGS23DRAFT_573575 [Durotheca rogersii]
MAAVTIDPAHKDRIISHMNADHSRELEHYLRAYNGLSASAARGAQLADLKLDAMIITTPSPKKTHSVAINPPLGSASDARIRLVEMAYAALPILGLSDVRISAWTWPRGAGLVSFPGVFLYFLCAGTLPLVQPGTAAWEFIDAKFPSYAGVFSSSLVSSLRADAGIGIGGALTYVWLVKAIFLPVLLIHIGEAWWVARSRLRPHGVDTGSGLWWLWVVNTFFEGLPAIKRFDGLVAAERQKKEATKH